MRRSGTRSLRWILAVLASVWTASPQPAFCAADPPAEQGGPGFEAVAEKLGFVTHTFTEADLKHFGDPKAKKGGSITEVVPRFPITFRPIGQHSNYQENFTISSLVYEGLLDLHPTTLQPIPMLATHWKISEDKLTYTFRIDPRARWSDGKPVTAHDVVATWRLMMDESILFPSSQLVFGKLEEPVALSQYIVEVRAKTLNWRNFLYFGSSMVILPARYIANLTGTEFLEQYQLKMLPGSGPYTIQEADVQNQQGYALTRRDDWWGKDFPQNRHRYNFDKIRMVVVQDNERLELEKLKKGEQDLYLYTRAQWWAEESDFDAVKKGWVQKRRVYNDLPAGTSGMAYNLRKPPFDDLRVRQAFAHLMPRERMIQEMFFNQYVPVHSNYAGSVYENPDNPKYMYDPAKAQQLLAEAGWKERNADGWLVKDGKPFVVELSIPQVLERIYTPFQQELKKIGIDFQLKLQDQNTLFKMMMERSFLVASVNWTGLVFPNPETSLKGELADKPDNNNISGVKNARIDELCDLYDRSFDQAERVKIVREIDKITQEILPTLLFWTAPYKRIVYWNKFGVPQEYFTRYEDFEPSIFKMWWYDAEKDRALQEAMKSGASLPVGEIDVKYWPEFSAAERAGQAAPAKPAP